MSARHSRTLCEILVDHRLISGNDVRQATHVTGALHVVLPAQRIDARTGLPEISGQQSRFASAWTLSTPCEDCVMPIAQKMAALPAWP